MRREIGQARALLEDAVEKLTTGFAAVCEVVRSCADAAAVQRADRELVGIVTALQFQDLLNQLLGHMVRRLDALESALDRDAAIACADAAMAPHPVAQHGLDEGEAELF